VSTDPRIDCAVLTEDDLPTGMLRDPLQLSQSLQAGERSMERIPARYRDAVVSVPAVAGWVRTLVQAIVTEKPRLARLSAGPSLLLIGGTGTGKTHQAYAAIRALAASGVGMTWQAVAAADLYAQMRPRYGVDSEQEFERYARASVLVLDDLGAAKGSEWNEEVNYRLVNHRYERQMPTLITSNVPPKNLAAALGERVASRLVEMAERVVIAGGDRRLNPGGAG
jgi:DNA replication protein DnaC